METGFKINIEKKSIANKYYRKVLCTTPQMQLVLMSIPPTDDIPLETHVSTTQFIRVESGTCLVLVSGKRHRLSSGDSIVIPPSTQHYVKNTGKTPLKLYTIYSPPEHKPDTIQLKHPKKIMSPI